ncbi:MAG: hypothetical protein HUJ65_00550, partial [Oscillospiraceae bacterium]|nr:hypothetical protein [Oscillospiraceae bacterium]
MKKTMKKLITALLLVTLLCALMVPALAENSLGITVPVKVTVTGNAPATAETYEITITPDEDNENDTNEEATEELTVSEDDDGNLVGTTSFELEYTEAGTYKYTITMEEGDADNATYDETVYYLTVTVSEDDDVLSISAVMYDAEGEDEEDKKTSADFEVEYDYHSLTIVKVDKADNDVTLEDAVFTLEKLKSDGTTVDTSWDAQTLTTEEDGTVTFDELPDGKYKLTETTAPAFYSKLITSITIDTAAESDTHTMAANHYTVEIDTEDGVKTITVTVENEKTSIDTGVL